MLGKITFYLSIAFTVTLLVACDSNDIKVTIQNDGPDMLENVIVSTDHASYPVGDIPPGESAVKGIDVLGDSSLSIRHAGHPGWQTTDSYMTRGFVGEMGLELKNGKVIGFTEDLRIYP